MSVIRRPSRPTESHHSDHESRIPNVECTQYRPQNPSKNDAIDFIVGTVRDNDIFDNTLDSSGLTGIDEGHILSIESR